MVPLPRFAFWDDFNAWLEEQCRKRQAEILRGHTETIGRARGGGSSGICRRCQSCRRPRLLPANRRQDR
jgi:hypothetical protein